MPHSAEPLSDRILVNVANLGECHSFDWCFDSSLYLHLINGSNMLQKCISVISINADTSSISVPWWVLCGTQQDEIFLIFQHFFNMCHMIAEIKFYTILRQSNDDLEKGDHSWCQHDVEEWTVDLYSGNLQSHSNLLEMLWPSVQLSNTYAHMNRSNIFSP